MATIPSNQGAPQASNIAVQGALPLIGSPSRENGQSVLNSIDASLAKLFEDRNILLAGGGDITFTGGTQLDFTEALKLHINSRIAGGSPVIIDLGATSRSFSANGRMLYATIDRVAGTATVTADAATLPSVVAANVEVFLIAKRIDDADTTARVYFREGGTLGADETSKIFAGGGGGGTVSVKYDRQTPAASATTVVFAKTFKYLSNAKEIFRNGVLMTDVSPSTPTQPLEYKVTDNGNNSTTITLAAGYPADGSDEFELYYIMNTFDGIGLADKTITSARADKGTSGSYYNCSIADVSNKTEVTISGWKYDVGLASGQPHGDLQVLVNGQRIERLVAGKNDQLDGVLYEEVTGGSVVKIYQFTAPSTTAALPANTQIEIIKETYYASDVGAMTTNIVPRDNNTYSLGSDSLRWKDLYLNDGSLYIGDTGNSGVISRDQSTGKLRFKHSTADANWTQLGSGGGGAGGDPAKELQEAEASLIQEYENPGSQFIDDFSETVKGTLTNMAASSGKAFFSGVNTTGSVERKRETGITKTGTSGVVMMNLQAMAPSTTAIGTPTSATRTVYFKGNVTAWYPNGKKLIVAKILPSTDSQADGSTRHVFAADSTGVLLQFSITATPTYSSITDETTVTINNSNTFDISYGFSAANQPANIRFIPFNYSFTVNAANANPSGGQYETCDLKNVYALDTVVIQGEQFFSAITDAAITGRAMSIHAEASPSKQYKIFRVSEDNSGNEDWHFFGQIGSATPVYLGVKSAGWGGFGEEFSAPRLANKGQLAVADNGRGVALYSGSDGTRYKVGGVYFDLSIGSPTITALPDINTDVAGFVWGSNSTDYAGFGVAIDTVDCNFIATHGRRDDNTTRLGWYKWTGSSPTLEAYSNQTISGAYNLTSANRPSADILVTGSGTSHRTHYFYTDNTSFNLRGKYYGEGSGTASDYNGAADIATGGVTGNPTHPWAIAATATKGILYYFNVASSVYELNFRYFDLTGGSPAISSANKLVNVGSGGSGIVNDNSHGFSNSNVENTQKLLRQMIVSNPSDGNSIMISGNTLMDPDGVVRERLFEIRDITAYQGIHISQYTDSAAGRSLGTATQQQIAQTFTANTNRVRTIAFKMAQAGTIPAGNTVKCEIRATSGGLPTGSALYTSQLVSCDKISNHSAVGSSQWVYFNFDGVSLTNGTTYAAVLVPSFPQSSSNNLVIANATTNPYAGGQECDYNGTSWTAQASNDLCFEINGDWVSYMGNSEYNGNSFCNVKVHNMESSIVNQDNNQIQLLFRRVTSPSATTSEFSRCGHPYRRVGTWGSGTSQSIWTSLANAAYRADSFDPYMVLNLSHGNPTDGNRIDLNTGAYANSGVEGEDCSGFAHSLAAGSTNNRTTDASFQSGFCTDFDGVGNYRSYTDSNAFDLLNTKPFAIEVEIKPDTVAATMNIVGKYNGGASEGWILDVNSSGQARFLMINSGGSNIGQALSATSTITATTYKIIRVTYDGSGAAPKMYTATSPSGTFTEVTYSNQTAVSASVTVNLPLNIARINNSTNYFDGRIGYVKIINGSNSFVYNGFKNQAPLVSIQNIGVWLHGKQMLGQNGSNTNFAQFGQSKQNSALVDSYPTVIEASRTLTNTGKYMNFKINAERETTLDNSNIEGYNIKFS